MSRTLMYRILCLILITLAPISISKAADVQTPADTGLKAIKSEKIDETYQSGVVTQESLPQNKASFNAATRDNPEANTFKVPLPSTVWLMAGGLLALLLIRRRNR